MLGRRRRQLVREWNGFGIRALLWEGGCGRAPPHAGPSGVDPCEGASHRAVRRRRRPLRGDLPLRWRRCQKMKYLRKRMDAKASHCPHPLPKILRRTI